MATRKFIFFLLALLGASAQGADVTGSSKVLSFATQMPALSIRITGPNGFSRVVEGSVLSSSYALPDGLYRYEVTSSKPAAVRGEALTSSENNGRSNEQIKRRGKTFSAVMDHGYFRILAGELVNDELVEEGEL